jgi:DNA-binding LacI/PurR family transcriptional regulator
MPNVEGSCAATAHLIERGCRHIIMVDGQVSGEVDVSRLRLTGYRQALERSGIAFDPTLIVNIDAFTMQSGAEVARALAASRKRVDGIFCVTDTIAIGVLRGLADAGVKVPSKVKVIGFDNVDEGAFTVPSLSSIDPDHETMARTAVKLLVRRIKGGVPGESRQEFVSKFSVVERESTRG